MRALGNYGQESPLRHCVRGRTKQVRNSRAFPLLSADINGVANFFVYSNLKSFVLERNGGKDSKTLPPYQTALIGLVSGSIGPLCNAPIDTISRYSQETCSEPQN